MTRKLTQKITRVGDKYHMQVFLKRQNGAGTPYCGQGDFESPDAASAWFASVQESWGVQEQARLEGAAAKKRRAKENNQEMDTMLDHLFGLPFKDHAQLFQAEGGDLKSDSYVLLVLRDKFQKAREAVVLRATKEHRTEAEAAAGADNLVGKTWKQQFAKALSGELDKLFNGAPEVSSIGTVDLSGLLSRRLWEPSLEAKELLRTIRLIPSFKLLTLAHGENQRVLFAVNQWGAVGESPDDEAALLRSLDAGIAAGGSVFIRQRIPESQEMAVAPNGHVMLLPWHALFAVVTGNNRWYAISAEAVEHASTHELDGSDLAPEPRVLYRDFSEFCTLERAVPLK